MLCDDCKKNEACVHITQISTAGKLDKNLCEKCAAQYGNLVFDANKGFSVNDFLKGIFSSGQTRPEAEETVAQPEIICPNCGKSYHESFTYCPYCKTKLVQPSYTGNRYERALSAFWDNLSGGGQAVVVMAVLAALCFIAKSVQK